MSDWQTITLNNRVIRVRPRDAERLSSEGLTQPGADRITEEESKASLSVVDAGVVKTRAPKKKANKAAEKATEAAQEDLGNAIEGD